MLATSPVISALRGVPSSPNEANAKNGVIGDFRCDLDRDTGGSVDICDVAHVAEPFLSGRLRLEIVLHTVREVAGLGDKVRGVAGGVEFVDLCALIVGAKMKAFVD